MAMPAIGSQAEVDRRNPTNLQFTPNSVLVKMEKEAAEEQARQAAPPVIGLANYIRGVRERNKNYRINSGAENQILEQLRQSNSEYDPEMMAKIAAAKQNDIFMGLTGVKVRAADAWINDVLIGDRARNFDLDPTPIAELPNELKQGIVERVMEEYAASMQQPGAPPMPPSEVYRRSQEQYLKSQDAMQEEAVKRADRMANKIQDQFVEGGFYPAFEDAVFYAVRTLAGILKGPLVRKRPKPIYMKNPATNKIQMGVGSELINEWESVHPLDFYPSEGMKGTDDGPTWERIFFGRSTLYEMIGSPGYNDNAIRYVLQRYGRSGYREHDGTDTERAKIENRDVGSLVGPEVIEGGEFCGCVPGTVLIEEGVFKEPNGTPIQPMRDYHVSATMAADAVIYSEFSTDQFYRSPYSKTGYTKRPGSFWYDGVPKLMRDLQRLINADIRALAKNMSMASGPLTIINDINRLAKGQDVTSLHSHMVLQFINYANSQMRPIDFQNVPSNAAELMRIFDMLSRMADDFTGIPAYQYGNERASGAGRTLGGLSMLMSSSARGIKKVIARIDEDLVESALLRQFHWNMRYIDDESIKGDVKVVPRGILELIVKEQMAAQRLEFLRSTANPVDFGIMGPLGRAYVLRGAAEATQMDVSKIIPSDEELRAMQKQQREQPPPEGGQITEKLAKRQ